MVDMDVVEGSYKLMSQLQICQLNCFKREMKNAYLINRILQLSQSVRHVRDSYIPRYLR